ncbi:hypothetical protein OSB04_002412 [Centaurea solstitialis]|uniref:DUF4218 domain-containing protein n=1 Tax=Centaurea solstitialis TaxID=347529 RepID=A0AA38U5H9_9ASTR|nr:hypothetical protein OSB04_002412 [Centaurea solstitialis]
MVEDVEVSGRLPIAIQGMIPTPIWDAITELCIFFHAICSRVLHKDDLVPLQISVVQTICKLEKIFPRGFFDSMEYLVIHLACEAIIDGPVQYRLMYLYEWKLGSLKRTIRNKARVEGFIVESYLVNELSTYFSFYFDPQIETRHNQVHPFHTVFEERARRKSPNIDDVALEKLREERFSSWFDHHVVSSLESSEQLKSLARRPNCYAWSHPGYFVNGFRFHTVTHGAGRLTHNSSVYVRGSSYGESNESDYYEMLDDVIEVEYYGAGRCMVVLFKCTWFDTPSGLELTKTVNDVEVDENMEEEQFFQMNKRVTHTPSAGLNNYLDSVHLVTGEVIIVDIPNDDCDDANEDSKEEAKFEDGLTPSSNGHCLEEDNMIRDHPSIASESRTRGANRSMVTPRNPSQRATLVITESGRFKDIGVVRQMYTIFRANSRGLWSSWKKWPEELDKEVCLFWTNVMHNKWSDWMKDARDWAVNEALRLDGIQWNKEDMYVNRGYHPIWIPKEFWHQMIDEVQYLEPEEGGCGVSSRHTGGSIPTKEHRDRMQLGVVIPHPLRYMREFTVQTAKVRDVAQLSQGPDDPPIDEVAMWEQSAGGRKKGLFSGLTRAKIPMSDLRAQMERMAADHRKERETNTAMLAQQTAATNMLYDFLRAQGFDPPRPLPLGISPGPSSGPSPGPLAP